MGVTGFCMQNDAIGMLNDFQAKQEDKTRKLIPRITSLRQNHFNVLAQSFIGHRLAEHQPFNPKIDNFLEIEDIENFVISSIQDEEVIDRVQAVGVCQFYNKVASDVTQEDLARVFYLRKLIGSQTVTCEYV